MLSNNVGGARYVQANNQVVMPVGSTIVFPLAFVDQNYMFFILNSISFKKPRQSTTGKVLLKKRRLLNVYTGPLKVSWINLEIFISL